MKSSENLYAPCIIRRMSIACCVPKTTHTHSEYVIIIAFLLQLWSHEGASMLRYVYIACHVVYMTHMFVWDPRTLRDNIPVH